MNTYRLKLTPSSPWASPWHAGSIFGALAWRCAETYGHHVLVNWIEAFEAGHPPFLISDAMPGDWFPAPVGPAYQTQLGGKAKPPVWVSAADFRRMLADPDFRSPASISIAKKFEHVDRRHASLGRASDTSDAGGALFEVEQEVLAKDAGDFLSLYVRADSPDTVSGLMELLSLTGFGRKSSTGLGAFQLNSGPEPCPWLDTCEGANGFIALSHFVPAASDPVRGAWRTHVSYPKYHGTAVSHPFKGRLLQLTPGSWLETGEKPREWYGCAVKQPCQEFPQAIQYAFALAAPARVNST